MSTAATAKQTSLSTKRITRADLNIALPIQELIEDRILPGTGISSDHFWKSLGAIIHDLTPEVRALLGAAAQQDRPPLAPGRGKLIIRSISAKQRPRRQAATKKERASRG